MTLKMKLVNDILICALINKARYIKLSCELSGLHVPQIILQKGHLQYYKYITSVRFLKPEKSNFSKYNLRQSLSSSSSPQSSCPLHLRFIGIHF